MRKHKNIDPVFGSTFLRRETKDCTIEIHARPEYCDRGSVEVHLNVNNPRNLSIDVADGFPRTYFDLDRAKGEVDDWIDARHQHSHHKRDWEVKQHNAKTIAVAAMLKHIMKVQ